jgi:flagellar basal body-associated protein FliL
MKNKKSLIISMIVTILVVACVVGGFLYYQNMKKNQEEEYNEALKKYERIVEVAEKVNTTIDEKLTPAKEFIATNPDVRK